MLSRPFVHVVTIQGLGLISYPAESGGAGRGSRKAPEAEHNDGWLLDSKAMMMMMMMT